MAKTPPDWKVAVYLALDDACPACKELDGRRVSFAEIEDHPEMTTPHPGCTHPEGCRCVVMASSEEP